MTLRGFQHAMVHLIQQPPLVRRLAAETDRRITLTTQDRRPIADSAAAAGRLPARRSAVGIVSCRFGWTRPTTWAASSRQQHPGC